MSMKLSMYKSKNIQNSNRMFFIKKKVIKPVSDKENDIKPVIDKNKFYENDPDESANTFMIFRMEM